MADVISSTRSALGLIGTVIDLVQEHRALSDKYGDALNELLLIRFILIQIEGMHRKPDGLDHVMRDLRRKLESVQGKLNRRLGKPGPIKFAKTLFWQWRDDPAAIADSLKKMSRRLELLRELKTLMDGDARFDASGVLEDMHDPSAETFWNHSFGSETQRVPFEHFMQAIELLEHRRMRRSEHGVLRAVLDPNGDEQVSVFEYKRWLLHFGPFNVALPSTLESLFDVRKNRVHDWFRHDLYYDAAKDLLRGRPGRFLVRFGPDHDGSAFYIDICDRHGKIREVCVSRSNDRFEPVVCQEREDGRPTRRGERRFARWLIQALRISAQPPPPTFGFRGAGSGGEDDDGDDSYCADGEDDVYGAAGGPAGGGWDEGCEPDRLALAPFTFRDDRWMQGEDYHGDDVVDRRQAARRVGYVDNATKLKRFREQRRVRSLQLFEAVEAEDFGRRSRQPPAAPSRAIPPSPPRVLSNPHARAERRPEVLVDPEGKSGTISFSTIPAMVRAIGAVLLLSPSPASAEQLSEDHGRTPPDAGSEGAASSRREPSPPDGEFAFRPPRSSSAAVGVAADLQPGRRSENSVALLREPERPENGRAGQENEIQNAVWM